jgi:hypothetical protein
MKLVPIALSALLATGCSSMVCDGSDERVEFARSLSKARLAQLHADMVRLSKDPAAKLGWPGELPRELQDLEPHSAEARAGLFRVVLKHCMDHSITLSGQTSAESPSVELSWGEGPTSGQQVLWRGPAP